MNIIRKTAAALSLASLSLILAPVASAEEGFAGRWLASQFSTLHADGRAAPRAADPQQDGLVHAQAWLSRQLSTGHALVPPVPAVAMPAMASETDFVRLWLHRQFAPDHMLPRS
ncbi:MAG: hypothetical protein KDG55_13905 [Rhodocyclaceae bacterium]|nr:hypothetical protein [Rhodocyclaceae bacterium]